MGLSPAAIPSASPISQESGALGFFQLPSLAKPALQLFKVNIFKIQKYTSKGYFPLWKDCIMKLSTDSRREHQSWSKEN